MRQLSIRFTQLNCFPKYSKSLIVVFLVFTVNKTHGQCNPQATLETKNLLKSLSTIWQIGIMLGHQDALAYGLTETGQRWIATGTDYSDIHSITGQHPAVVGHDLGYIELKLDKNLDGVLFEHIRQSIIATYQRGGVNTVSWHPNNPLDLSKTSWDSTENTIPAILNNVENRDIYLGQLDVLAAFFKSLKTPDDLWVPVIFRPFHEHTGSWFWWGADYCTPEEYKEFWRLTVEYLQRKQVNNLLFCYSTDYFNDERHYLERYPGDDYVDILGFDAYHRNAPESNFDFISDVRRMGSVLKKLGQEKKKPWALTETGLEQVTESAWWSAVLLEAVKDSGLSYVLVWRNGRPDHYYAPYPSHPSSDDFKKVVEEGKFLLENAVRSVRLYQSN